MLTLQIKKKWFDMILSGEKKEEYRDLKPYYQSRFRNVWGNPLYWSDPHYVMFRNGYRADSPSFIAACTLSIRHGKIEWGAEKDSAYYVLSILRIFKSEE